MGYLLAIIKATGYNAVMTHRVIGPLNKVTLAVTASANERRTREAVPGSR